MKRKNNEEDHDRDLLREDHQKAVAASDGKKNAQMIMTMIVETATVETTTEGAPIEIARHPDIKTMTVIMTVREMDDIETIGTAILIAHREMTAQEEGREERRRVATIQERRKKRLLRLPQRPQVKK